MYTCQLKNAIVTTIAQPIVTLLFVAALLVFLWGVIEFLWDIALGGSGGKKGSDGKSASSGKQHMLWGIIGLVIMSGSVAIVRLIGNTVGFAFPAC